MLKFKSNGIGILGGSFDPPHKGHLKISNIAIKKLKLKKAYWVITKQNPFKKKPLFNLKKRILLSKKVTKKNKKIKVIFLDNKIKSTRIIKTINYFLTVKKIKNLFLIIGSDNLITFHKWKNWKEIIKKVKVVVFSRKGYDIKSKKSIVAKYLNKHIIFIKNKPINISSSKIKKKLLTKF